MYGALTMISTLIKYHKISFSTQKCLSFPDCRFQLYSVKVIRDILLMDKIGYSITRSLKKAGENGN